MEHKKAEPIILITFRYISNPESNVINMIFMLSVEDFNQSRPIETLFCQESNKNLSTLENTMCLLVEQIHSSTITNFE